MDHPFLSGATLVVLLGLIGGAVRWVWTATTERHDHREATIDEREAAFNKVIDSRLDEMRGTIGHLFAKVDALGELVGKQRTAIHLLVAEVQRNNPSSPALDQVDRLLGEEFPLFLQTLPPAMREQIRQLDEDKGGDE